MGAPASPTAAVPQRSVGTGSTLGAASQLTAALAGGLTGVVVARLLGPDGTGSFNLAAASLGLALVVGTLGLEFGTSYYVSRGDWPPAEALWQLQLAALALGLAVAGLAVALVAAGAHSAFRGVPVATFAVALSGLPFGLSLTFGSYLFLSLDRYEAFAFIPAGQAVASLALVGALTPPFGVDGAVVGFVAGRAGASAVVVSWAARTFGGPPPDWLRTLRPRLRRAAGFGIRANFSNVLQQLNYRADLFFLNAFAARAVVGRYAIAVALTSLTLVLPRALGAVLMPRVAALDTETDHGRLDAVTVKAIRHGVIAAGVSSLVLALGLLAVPVVYGRAFEQTIALGYILLPGVAAVAVSGVLAAIVVGRGHPRYSLRTVLIVTPVTLVLYATLIPVLHATGAALASTLSYAATFLVWSHYFRRVTGARGLAPFVPGRAELSDYRALARRVRARLRPAAG